MQRETLRKILLKLLTTVGHVTFNGLEHLPPEGGLIVATNHMSRMDTLHLFINPARTDLTALVADKYKKYPVFNWVLDTGKVIWLDRSQADFTAFGAAADALKSGLPLGIAPEGTRSTTGELQAGKPGAVLLAYKARVPIIPVGISGTETYFKDLLRFRRPRVTVNFGPAFQLPPIDRNNRDESLRQQADEIMARIAVLLPPKHWGVYKDHPRVKELLIEQKAGQPVSV